MVVVMNSNACSFVLVASLLSCGAAQSADLSGLVARGSIEATAYDWSGSYLGAHLGYGLGRSANHWAPTTSDPWTIDGDIDFNGANAGVHAGYQAQFGNVVVGAEADLSGAHMIGNDAQFAGLVNEIEVSMLGTLRGRIGLAYDGFLLFATGGVAAADLYKRDLDNQYSSRNFTTGAVLGAGLEVALTDNVRVRAEYQHIWLDRVDAGIIGASGGGYLHRADNPSLDIVRAGVSYAF